MKMLIQKVRKGLFTFALSPAGKFIQLAIRNAVGIVVITMLPVVWLIIGICILGVHMSTHSS